MTKDNPPTPDPAVLLDEMSLYYEEIRSVNDRSLTYVKLLGVLALSLATYMFFGLRLASTTSLTPQTPSASALPAPHATSQPNSQPTTTSAPASQTIGNTDATDAKTPSGIYLREALVPPQQMIFAAWAYAVIGIGLTGFFQFVCCYALIQYGRSKVHKTRYWRAISILREKLHTYNSILPQHGRAVPIQTGLELCKFKNYSGLVPRPVIRAREYNFGYFLATVSLGLFVVPLLLFATICDYAISDFKSDTWVSLSRGTFCASSFIALVAFLLFHFAFKVCEDLKGAQFATDRMLEPTVEGRQTSAIGRAVLVVFRLSLVVWGLAYLWIACRHGFRGSSANLPQWWWGGLLVGGVLLERVATTFLKQYSIGEMVVRLVAKALRMVTRQEIPMAGRILSLLFGKERMRQIVERGQWPRTLRPRGDSARMVCIQEKGSWTCYQQYRPEMPATAETPEKALGELIARYRNHGFAQEQADAVAYRAELRRRRRGAAASQDAEAVSGASGEGTDLPGVE